MTDCTLEANFYHDTPELLVTIDTDSWIENEFERDEELDALLDSFREQLEADPGFWPYIRRDYHGYPEEGEVMDAFPRYVYERAMENYNALSENDRADEYTPKEPTGFYGEGEPVHVFTPNGECFLSTDVQFVLWGNENGSFAVLRKADSYNGHGVATAYRVLGYDGTEPLDFASAIIACAGGENPNPGQLAIDGKEWEPCRATWDHIPGHNGVDQGHGFGVLPGYRENGDYPAEIGTEGKRGTLVIDNDEHIAFCPVCGTGKLTAGKY